MDASSFDEIPAASSSSNSIINNNEIPAKACVRTPVPPAGIRRSSHRHTGHRGSIAEHPPTSAETPLTTERQQQQQKEEEEEEEEEEEGGAIDLDERIAALTIRNQNIIADNNMNTPAGGSTSFDDGTREKDTTTAISDIFALHELSAIVDRTADEE